MKVAHIRMKSDPHFPASRYDFICVRFCYPYHRHLKPYRLWDVFTHTDSEVRLFLNVMRVLTTKTVYFVV